MHTIPAGSDTKRAVTSPWKDRGGVLMTSDQSQCELRTLAALCAQYYGDNTMAQGYINGLDIHKLNASKVFNVPYDEVLSDQRRFSKAISFALLYGSSEKSVAETSGKSLEETHMLFEAFYNSYPGIRKFQEASWEFAQKYGCIRTPMGRIKHLLEAQSPDKRISSKAKRQSGNAPIQSSASDLSVNSINFMTRYIREHNMKSYVYGFIHDACYIAAAPGEFNHCYNMLRYSMKDLNEDIDWINHQVTLGVDVEFGTTQADTIEVHKVEGAGISEDGKLLLEFDERDPRTYYFEGWKSQIDPFLKEMSIAYDMEDIIEEEEEEVIKTQDLIKRKAINLAGDGSAQIIQKHKLTIARKDKFVIPDLLDVQHFKFRDPVENQLLRSQNFR